MDSPDFAKFARPRSLLREVYARLRRCLLCNSKHPVIVAAFVPNTPALFFDVPPDAKGEMFYLLCEKCFKKDPQVRNEEVESALLALAAVERDRKGQTVQ